MDKKSFCVSLKYQNIQSELEIVLDALHNERNLTLVSSSKSKRADLILQTFSFLRNKKRKLLLIYIDISDSQTMDELSKLCTGIVIGKTVYLRIKFSII